ncbi:MAG: hypothetical protein H6678_13315 [Candidatus Delongbacteria bacterium]|nr:hypothetical protein [Candidatus Cloacimonadota bacterium]MCA9787073.1 hypothetical protein [Candidatus Cloacimonadota bacterium]MCB9474774.1 hypothetical protein [Candidatus Delongbacteria bacterium]
MNARTLRLLLASLWLTLCGLASPVQAMEQSQARELFLQSNQAYEAGDWGAAVAGYDSLARAGFDGLELWYNLGNSHFRLGETGLAILSWRRAEAISPFDRDVQKNLEIASHLLSDDLGQTVRLPIWDWLDRVLESLPRDGTAVALLVLLALWSGLRCLRILERLAPGATVRSLQWISGLAALLLLVLLSLQIRHRETSRHLVILAQRATVHAAPLADAEALFDLHEGTTVRLVSEGKQWWRLRLPDGREGWLPQDKAAIVESRP